MRWMIDHVFVMTEPGASAGDDLVAVGLREGSPNVHPGQGTANRRFFFEDFMLELFWVHDLEEASSDLVRRTGLAARFVDRERGACPFGVCIRSSEAGARPPFSTWTYTPPYVPPGTGIAIALGSDDIAQPLVFAVTGSGRRDEPTDHRCGFRRLTRVHLRYPAAAELPESVAALVELGLVSCSAGEPCLELGFDGERRGSTIRAEGLGLILRG